MHILKKGLFFSLLVAIFYILSPMQIISAEEGKPKERHSWFNGLLCKEHNPAGIGDVIIRSFEQAIALCGPPKEKEKYNAIKDMYQKILQMNICSEINLPEQSSGTQCLSHQGGMFEIYENPETRERSIIDLSEDGKIWFDYLLVQRRHKKAIEICEENNRRLPTREEFIKAEENGIREAFYNNLYGEKLWAFDGRNTSYAYVFDGSEGLIKNDYYGYKAGQFLSAICIQDKN